MSGFAAILACLLVSVPVAGSGVPALHYTRMIGGLSLSVLEIDVSQARIVSVSARGSDYAAERYRAESFASMARRSSALAAINGCYFDGSTKRPIGDISEGGKMLHSGGGWAHFGVRRDGSVGLGAGYPDWSGFRMGITCLPFMVRKGTVLIRSDRDLADAGFRDGRVFATARRSAVALTARGKVLLVASGVARYPAFADALRSIGAEDALGLDGGASTAMYWNGRVVVAPGRDLATILAVVIR